MTTQEYTKLTKILEEQEEVAFTHNNHFIFVQTCSEGGFDGSVYNSKDEYENEEEPLGGGVTETILECVALGFFIEISDNLKK